ncbi:MAG: dephospho-CoA kinase [Bacteroidales bacterium]
MLKIGLTGNIGSGKSTIAEIFKVLGVEVYHADDNAKSLLNKPEVCSKIIGKFGESVLTNGSIDKKKLADIVFTDAESLEFLNKSIHPLLKIDFDNWLLSKEKNNQYIIIEAAILFESGFDKYVDKTILITAAEKIRMKRVCERDNISEILFLQRSTNQWKESQKLELADFVVINDETQLVLPQILELHSLLCEGSK